MRRIAVELRQGKSTPDAVRPASNETRAQMIHQMIMRASHKVAQPIPVAYGDVAAHAVVQGPPFACPPSGLGN